MKHNSPLEAYTQWEKQNEEDCYEAFLAGAKWMRDQIGELNPEKDRNRLLALLPSEKELCKSIGEGADEIVCSKILNYIKSLIFSTY